MTFADFNLNKPLWNALADLNYTTPTPIQAKSFAIAMSGKNVVGIAQTGTGKTMAYLLPCLRQWAYSKEGTVQTLILVPTRELVAQIVEEIEKLTPYMNVAVVGIHGGGTIHSQTIKLSQRTDIIVATPGRLLDLILNRVLEIKYLKRLVIDEVDEMLSLGFRPQLVRVLDLLPDKRQNLMFSATMGNDVEEILHDFFGHAEIIEAAPAGQPLEKIKQSAYEVPNYYTKINLLKYLLADDENFHKVLVFTASKKLADRVYEAMFAQFGRRIGVVHSGLAQNKRFATVQNFKDAEHRVLVSTDLIARGLDIAEVSHVINFDLPDEAESYIHRIGRTGRADLDGIAMSFITPRDEDYRTAIEELMDKKIPTADFPEAVEISKELTPEEMPKTSMKEIQRKIVINHEAGPAFHERSAKRQKKILTREEIRASRAPKKARGKKKPMKRR